MCDLMAGAPYGVIATLGPATSQTADWLALRSAGATGFRLNTSHLTLDALQEWLARWQQADLDCGLVLDLQGSKWRLGQLAETELGAGRQVRFVHARQAAADELPVPHADFFRAAQQATGEVVLNDGRVRVALQWAEADAAGGTVVQGGRVSAAKGITLPNSPFRVEALSDKDAAIVELTRRLSGIAYAVSYVRDALELEQYRTWFGGEAQLIAKIERPSAVDDALSIGRQANAVWVCRGDLGAEMGLRGMAQAVARLSAQLQAGQFSVPVWMAGQVLEHMTHCAQPTRAEVCQLYDVLAQGYAGVVLSDETALGHFAEEACRVAALFCESKPPSRG
ncbi:MAG: hypothetical protein LDL12_07910 [Anaerolinea sp.]|nr:hypothetical protein [Anaerolinea sp.]